MIPNRRDILHHMDTLEQEPAIAPRPKNGGSAGPIVAIVIILLLIAAGGVYYFTTGVKQIFPEEEAPLIGDDETSLREQGSSTNLVDIEADLNATDFSGLDGAANDFESELGVE